MKGFLTGVQTALRGASGLTYLTDVVITNRSTLPPDRSDFDYLVTLWPMRENEEYRLNRTARKFVYAGIACWMNGSFDPDQVAVGGQAVPAGITQFVEDVKAALRGNNLSGYLMDTAEGDQGTQEQWVYRDAADGPWPVMWATGIIGGQRDLTF